jgi:hypothetical protein
MSDAVERLAAALHAEIGQGWSGTPGLEDMRELAFALLAPGSAVDELRQEAAADELEAAAEEVRDSHGTASLSAKRIDARASALRAHRAEASRVSPTSSDRP